MREVINPLGVTDAPKYGWSHAVKASGPLLFVSGQVAYDDRGNVVAQWPDKTNRMEMVGEPVGLYVPRKLGSQFLHE